MKPKNNLNLLWVKKELDLQKNRTQVFDESSRFENTGIKKTVFLITSGYVIYVCVSYLFTD